MHPPRQDFDIAIGDGKTEVSYVDPLPLCQKLYALHGDVLPLQFLESKKLVSLRLIVPSPT